MKLQRQVELSWNLNFSGNQICDDKYKLIHKALK